jgi:hypothetical protein
MEEVTSTLDELMNDSPRLGVEDRRGEIRDKGEEELKPHQYLPLEGRWRPLVA